MYGCEYVHVCAVILWCLLYRCLRVHNSNLVKTLYVPIWIAWTSQVANLHLIRIYKSPWFTLGDLMFLYQLVCFFHDCLQTFVQAITSEQRFVHVSLLIWQNWWPWPVEYLIRFWPWPSPSVFKVAYLIGYIWRKNGLIASKQKTNIWIEY